MKRFSNHLIICFLGCVQIVYAQSGQLAVPRVDLMPNQPTPYNVRDWKQVAMRYDSFVYDVQKTGQYLPLTFINPAGVNYPQRPSFRMHTYVGTNSPFGNEAINVLPSLVGASLVGIDKSNQFGRNWVLMAQDFYNKNNGENLYLNAPSTTSGNDWWYDMMPNVYFYQLYDLYPDMGGEADLQFTAIADRFAEAVRTMGGNDAPWQPAYMNYRAWRFRTMEPNAVGVPEPEAAGAFAWVLYNAWKTTGNQEYLKAAEWSLAFLNNWTSNPSYELQLPYGTLAAARMNAELGAAYDVGKLLNWSFDRGNLRGWGTITGTWGGFNVSGLVGEANDAGNDYAFQLNGVQQAAALVPMVRYDKRFARAVGKWMLNLSNATRLFYPGFLPPNLQDASAWSAVHDPDQVISYEALRQVWQGNSPYATGDALNGGWAATNLALYGSSSIGYLGAMVEKTNVDRILKIDVLKTDFFNDAAYPTYLIYNSYATARSVQLPVGDAASDVYDALTEDFIMQNVTGTVPITIPANQAVLVSICPTGGVITYDQNKMLVNGVVVDYRQSAQPYAAVPRIQALASAANPLEVGAGTTLYCTVFDADSDQLSYEWSANAGTIEGESGEVVFNAPPVAGEVRIEVIVSDPQGDRDTAALLIDVVPEINYPPVIAGIQKSSPYLAPGETLQFSCLATDPNNDAIQYAWTASSGSFSGTGSTLNWTAPAAQGIYQISVTATDPGGLEASASTTILVKIFNAGVGNLVAHYPFTGNANDVSGNQLHGQPNGVLLTNDMFGTAQRAYYFNGGAQHISVPNSPLLNFQNGITVSCWFNAYALPDRETFLLSHGSWQNRWKLSITPDRQPRWTVNSLSGIADLDAVAPLRTDSFYHIAATYDGSTLAMYLGGELHSYKALNGLMRTAALPFLMGQMLPSDANYNFKGVMDEVKIYNYALIPEQVRLLHEQEATSVRNELSQTTGMLKVFPNPASDLTTATLPEDAGTLERLYLFDVAGHIVREWQGSGTSSMPLELAAVPPGAYTLHALGSNGRYLARLIKL
jgi:hypothetical protein